MTSASTTVPNPSNSGYNSITHHEAVVFDDVGLDHGAEPLEQRPDGVRRGRVAEVTQENLGGARPDRHLDAVSGNKQMAC